MTSGILLLVGFIILIVCIYAFLGVFALIPYFFGVLYGVFIFPIQIISQVIYPVGNFPYAVWSGGILFVFLLWFFHLITQKKS